MSKQPPESHKKPDPPFPIDEVPPSVESYTVRTDRERAIVASVVQSVLKLTFGPERVRIVSDREALVKFSHDGGAPDYILVTIKKQF